MIYTTLDQYEKVFNKLMSQIDIIRSYCFLIDQYTQPKRNYHNIFHINDCLETLNIYKDEMYITKEEEILLQSAIWFHDAIYNTFYKNNMNEMNSISLLYKYVGSNYSTLALIKDLILSTRIISIPRTSIQKYMKDIDMCILGKDPEEFHTYRHKIRKEFWFIPNFIFKKKSVEFFMQFIKRGYVFESDLFKKYFESQAMKNILKEVCYLQIGEYYA